jgi:glycosyltransferase involved in cell wall biosynthesis
MSTPKPLVSIIIPCYRQAQFLRTAIDSALAQSYPHIEVIVVNDGSDDNTEEVAKSYGDRIRYIWRPNGGLSAARNTAIAHAKGEYFKFLDSDDHLGPDQIAWHMEALEGRPDALSMTGVRLYRDGKPEESEDHTPTYDNLLLFLLQDSEHWMPPVGYLVPAVWVRAVNGFKEDLPCLEDWDFFSRIGLHDPPLICDQRIGGYYRLCQGSMSSNRQRMAKTRARILIPLHDLLREKGRRDWFGPDLLKSEQDTFHGLIRLDQDEPELKQQLLVRIKELQRREGNGQNGWRFHMMTRLVGYERAERIRCGMVKLLKIRHRQTLDTGAWREAK